MYIMGLIWGRYIGDKQEVGHAEMCVLYVCYVGSEDVGNLEDYVPWSVVHAFWLCQLVKPFC